MDDNRLAKIAEWKTKHPRKAFETLLRKLDTENGHAGPNTAYDLYKKKKRKKRKNRPA